MNENTYEDKNFAALILETCWTKPVEDEINVNSMKLVCIFSLFHNSV